MESQACMLGIGGGVWKGKPESVGQGGQSARLGSQCPVTKRASVLLSVCMVFLIT